MTNDQILVPAWFVGGLIVLPTIYAVVSVVLDVLRWRRVKRNLARHGVHV